MTELLIKNMVCQHCKQAVEKHLSDLGYTIIKVELGKAVISENLDSSCSLIPRLG